MKLLCKKEFATEDGLIAFVEGKEYSIFQMNVYKDNIVFLRTTNEWGGDHILVDDDYPDICNMELVIEFFTLKAF